MKKKSDLLPGKSKRGEEPPLLPTTPKTETAYISSFVVLSPEIKLHPWNLIFKRII